MSRIRLKTLVVAGCLTLEAAGCRSCLTAPLGHIRAKTPWSRSDNCAVTPPQAPVATSDQDRPIPPAASPSLASPESSEQYSEASPPAASESAASSEQPSLEAEQKAAVALKNLGGRVTADADGRVTAVDLAQTAITDEDLKLLTDCPGLVELNLRGTLTSDVGLETVSQLAQLEFLGLTGTMVTDAGIERLQQLRQLRFVTLGHTAVTDAGLTALARCKQLEGLNLKATPVTAAGLVEFQSQVPQCRIVSDITATTSIDSRDLPVPMTGDAATSTDSTEAEDATESADPPLPPADAPRALPENLTDPFQPIPTDGAPLDVPAVPEESSEPPQEVTTPDSAARVLRLPRPTTANNGPSQRLEHVLLDSLADPSVLRAIAASYSERGEWEAAAAVLRVAVERAPENHDLQFELGIAEARSGDYVAALMHLQQCGDLGVAHYNLGILLHEAGLIDASVLAFRSALRYDPNLHQARVWLSEVAPKQAAAAGQRPSMIGAPAATPVAPRATDGEPADGSGIEIRPASGRRVVKRPKLGATELGSRQPAARN